MTNTTKSNRPTKIICTKSPWGTQKRMQDLSIMCSNKGEVDLIIANKRIKVYYATCFSDSKFNGHPETITNITLAQLK